MSKTLNFNTVKKQYFTVTLPDKKKTTIMIGTPKKNTMDELKELESALESSGDDNDYETIDILYSSCAKIMSENKGGVEIEKKLLEEVLDVEDIVIFFKEYMSFVHGIGNSKN